MATDLVLRSSCDRCGSTSDLYGSNCKHLTLCFACGKVMATNRAKCNFCFIVVSRLIREYNVRASASTDKDLFIARFATDLPPFSKKKSVENKWTLHKDGIQGRQLTDSLQEKNRKKAFVLEDETCQHQYQGQPMEGTQSATYYLLIMHGKGFVASPACSWYNFNKIAQYRQLSCEEAEEKMVKRERYATGYGRWIMKAPTNGVDGFAGKKGKQALNDDASDNNQPGKGGSDDENTHSVKSDKEIDEEVARKSRLARNERSFDGDDDGYGLEGDDIEIGDDWEHEETFTDDDEAVGNDLEERGDLDLEVPAPLKIKLDDEDEDDKGLSTSGAELKKLLGRVAGLNESDADTDEDDNDMDDDNSISPVLVPKHKYVIKDEPASSSPSKSLSSTLTQVTPITNSSKAKRKLGNDLAMSTNGALSKKLKIDNVRASVKDEHPTFSKSNVPLEAPMSASSRTGLSPSIAPVTIDEIKAALSASTQLTTLDLVARFKERLQSPEDRQSFTDTMKAAFKIERTDGCSYVVLK